MSPSSMFKWRKAASGLGRAVVFWCFTALIAGVGIGGCSRDDGTTNAGASRDGPSTSTSAASSSSLRPRFATTIPPAAAILREVVKGRGEVVELLPAGVSPHTYEPRPSDVRTTADALALFYVADTLDGWAAQLPAKHRVSMLDLVPESNRLGWGSFHDGHGDETRAGSEHLRGGGQEAGDWDPHFWMDPLAVKAMLPKLVETLSTLDPGGRETYQANAARFATELDELNTRLASILAPVRGDPVVLFHPSVRYLLNRYGLKLFRVIEASPGKEPSPRFIEDLVNDMKGEGVKALFTEPQLSPRPVQVIAEAAGLPVRTLDPLGGETGRTSYSELLLYNARALAGALR